MWNWADDYGIGSANGKQLVGFAFPNDDEITAKDFPTLRKEVSDCFGVIYFEHEGRPFFTIPSWDKHQRTERKAKKDEALIAAAQRAVLAHKHAEVGTTEESGGLSDATQGDSGVGTGEREQGNRGKGTGEQGNSNPPNPPRGNRGQRLSEDWRPSQRTVDTIVGEYPGFDYGREHKRFVDYWIAQPGQRGVKLDWDATWRNWMRRKGDEGGGAVVSRLPVGKQSAGDKARAIADELRREGL